MTEKLGRGMIVDGHADPRPLKGVARRREIREQNIQEVECITAHLIAGLGRPPIGGETVAAEVIGVTLVQSRRLRERGRDDSGERQLLRQMLSFSPFGLAPAAPPPRSGISAVGKDGQLVDAFPPVADVSK